MLPLLRGLHTLTVALWFGAVAFFTVAGVLIFSGFTDASRYPAEHGLERWLPEPTFPAQVERPEEMPDLLRERGSRLAGVAVSRIFPVYYALQAGCAVVALLTALLLARSGEGAAHAVRVTLCLLALGTVAGGWWLEMRVSQLRQPRNTLTDQALARPTPERVAEAVAARAEFLRWHNYSLAQNFATLALALSLTALVPAVSPRRAG